MEGAAASGVSVTVSTSTTCSPGSTGIVEERRCQGFVLLGRVRHAGASHVVAASAAAHGKRTDPSGASRPKF
jgi:hypothetical protein